MTFIMPLFTLLIHMFTPHTLAHVPTVCTPNEHHSILITHVVGCADTARCMECNTIVIPYV